LRFTLLFGLQMFLMAACSSPKPTVPYSVVGQWSNPDGLYGRVVVVDPTQRSEAGLLALTEQLRRDTKTERNVFVCVYDDARAASRETTIGERLSKQETQLYNYHFIGGYIRDEKTGYHVLRIQLQGLCGPAKEIRLQ
jgi:hypothetical protein